MATSVEVTVSSPVRWIGRLQVGTLLICRCRGPAKFYYDVFILRPVASGRFAPKQRKGAREVDAGNESGSFAINVDDARFSSIFTGDLIPSRFCFLCFVFISDICFSLCPQIQILLSTLSILYSSALLACSRFCKRRSQNASNPSRPAAAATATRTAAQTPPRLQGA
jgi:hypothetical protein